MIISHRSNYTQIYFLIYHILMKNKAKYTKKKKTQQLLLKLWESKIKSKTK